MTRALTQGPGCPWRRISAFTLIEVIFVVAIAGVLAMIAVPAYQGYVERSRMAGVVAQIRWIEDLAVAFQLENRVFPGDLAAVGADRMRDAWGNPYEYLRIAGPSPPNRGQLRKDKNLVPINSDFDLYSMGPDGDSKKPLTAKASRDDIIRAADGAFVGAAEDY